MNWEGVQRALAPDRTDERADIIKAWWTGHTGCKLLSMLLDLLQTSVRFGRLGHEYYCSRRVSSDAYSF